MLTKGAIGNLVNRYKAVLKKCNLINTFGSLAVASMLVLGGAGVAGAESFSKIQDTAGYAIILDHNGKNGDGANSEDTITIKLNTPDTTTVSQQAGGIRSSVTSTLSGYKSISISGDAGAGSGGEKQHAIYAGGENTKLTITDIGHISIGSKNEPIDAGGITVNCATIDINAQSLDMHTTGNAFSIQSGCATDSNIIVTLSKDMNVSGGVAVNARSEGLIDISAENINISGKWALFAKNAAEIKMHAKENMSISGNYPVMASGANIELIADNNLVIEGDTAFDVYDGGSITVNATTSNIKGVSYVGYTDEETGESSAGTLELHGDVNIFDDVYVDKQGKLEGDATLIVNNKDAEFTVVDGGSVATTLSAKGSGSLNDQTGGDINALNEQLSPLGLVAKGMDEGMAAPAIGADGKAKGPNSIMDAALKHASINSVSLDRILTNDVRKRLGDIRSDANKTGVWMRWDGGKLKGDNGLTNEFNTIQIGGDTKVAKNCRLGVAGSFTHGEGDFARGSSELEGFSFAAYATWMGDNGMFADIVARLGHFSTEMNVEGDTGDMDNRVASISGEYGWRFNVCQQFFIEPQVELAYTYVNSEDLQLGNAKYQFDSVDSLTGRAGVVFGWNLPSDMGNVYARASVVQQFMGDAKISGAVTGGKGFVQEIDGDDTWLEYGIGANVKLTDNTYIWADVERTEGAEIDEEWRGTVGVRFSF